MHLINTNSVDAYSCILTHNYPLITFEITIISSKLATACLFDWIVHLFDSLNKIILAKFEGFLVSDLSQKFDDIGELFGKS